MERRKKTTSRREYEGNKERGRDIERAAAAGRA